MNSTKYTIDKLHLLLEELDGPHEQHTSRRSMYCDECKCDLVLCHYFYACPKCGQVDDKPVYDLKNESEYHPKPILYQRRLYCQDKLKLMSTQDQ